MELKLFKTLWGFKGTHASAAQAAMKQGYNGIEGPVPASKQEACEFAVLLDQYQLSYIAEVVTAGGYVPDRRLPLEAHLNDLHDNLERLLYLNPLFITCIGGCDAWTEDESVQFFNQAMVMAESYNRVISFETHRGRSLFNPWATQRIVEGIPDLRLTCDFSHWNVVCEGIQETEEAIIQDLLPNAWHIHGRVGYDQGPQVPHPRSPLYAENLKQHQKWWQWIWNEHELQARTMTTLTPEFGPDGYEPRDPETGKALVDIEGINLWIAGVLRLQFEQAFAGAEKLNREWAGHP